MNSCQAYGEILDIPRDMTRTDNPRDRVQEAEATDSSPLITHPTEAETKDKRRPPANMENSRTSDFADCNNKTTDRPHTKPQRQKTESLLKQIFSIYNPNFRTSGNIV